MPVIYQTHVMHDVRLCSIIPPQTHCLPHSSIVLTRSCVHCTAVCHCIGNRSTCKRPCNAWLVQDPNHLAQQTQEFLNAVCWWPVTHRVESLVFAYIGQIYMGLPCICQIAQLNTLFLLEDNLAWPNKGSQSDSSSSSCSMHCHNMKMKNCIRQWVNSEQQIW